MDPEAENPYVGGEYPNQLPPAYSFQVQLYLRIRWISSEILDRP